jgi:hypothetical protein
LSSVIRPVHVPAAIGQRQRRGVRRHAACIDNAIQPLRQPSANWQQRPRFIERTAVDAAACREMILGCRDHDIGARECDG